MMLPMKISLVDLRILVVLISSIEGGLTTNDELIIGGDADNGTVGKMENLEEEYKNLKLEDYKNLKEEYKKLELLRNNLVYRTTPQRMVLDDDESIVGDDAVNGTVKEMEKLEEEYKNLNLEDYKNFKEEYKELELLVDDNVYPYIKLASLKTVQELVEEVKAKNTNYRSSGM